MPRGILRKTRSEKQLADAIQYFINIDIKQKVKLHDIGRNIRNSYFEPISQDALDKLLFTSS